MAVIKVPQTPAKAFDKNRRPSALLLAQIAHLEWAALPASQRKPDQLPKRQVKTEAQAAARIEQLTRIVLDAKAASAGSSAAAAARAPVVLPPIPATARTTTGRRPAATTSARRRRPASTKATATKHKRSGSGRRRARR